MVDGLHFVLPFPGWKLERLSIIYKVEPLFRDDKGFLDVDVCYDCKGDAILEIAEKIKKERKSK